MKLHPIGKALIALSVLGLSLGNAGAASLPTEERDINSYAHGLTVYTCLDIDGGVVPLVVPYEARLEMNNDITLVWPKDRCSAVFRPATMTEAVLLDKMDQPDAGDLWLKYLASTFHGAISNYSLHEFQPNIIPVNHWHIGAISMDYTQGGINYTGLLLLWRSQDKATTIAVTMQPEANQFQAKRDAIYSMIGASMLMQK
jgi:hypothetical protein